MVIAVTVVTAATVGEGEEDRGPSRRPLLHLAGKQAGKKIVHFTPPPFFVSPIDGAEKREERAIVLV